MLFFVKDNTLHRFPVPKRCGVERNSEKLRDTVPHEVKKCVYCLSRWPADE
jgi:hypothetical protein